MREIVKQNTKSIKSQIKGKSNAKLLIHSVVTFHRSTDALVTTRLKEEKSLKFDCHKGCSTCCNLRVEVLPPEAFLIARHIEQLPEDERTVMIGKLEAHASNAFGKTFEEYEMPCPFLNKDGVCEIYDVRPFKCRTYYSMNVESCERKRSADEEYHLKMISNQLASETINLYKSKHLVMHPVELGQGVLKSLKDPSIRESWANGAQVFDLLPEKIML